MQNILAVAIGKPSKSRIISNLSQLTGARPYIAGLWSYLSTQKNPGTNENYKLGTDYIIDYQECLEGGEEFKDTYDIIFCMSTPVTIKAKKFTSSIPIVGIFSDPESETFTNTKNICGVNAQRFQIGYDYYDRFTTAIPGGLKMIYVLHRDGNTASKESWNNIYKGAHSVPTTLLTVHGESEIKAAVTELNPGSGGLLVLPVDLFFGGVDDIHSWAKVPVFWPVTDWVPPGIGGYGVDQATCGQIMGQQVKYIFEHNGNIPTDTTNPKRFITLDVSYRRWVASKAAAKAMKLELGTHKDLQHV